MQALTLHNTQDNTNEQPIKTELDYGIMKCEMCTDFLFFTNQNTKIQKGEDSFNIISQSILLNWICCCYSSRPVHKSLSGLWHYK